MIYNKIVHGVIAVYRANHNDIYSARYYVVASFSDGEVRYQIWEIADLSTININEYASFTLKIDLVYLEISVFIYAT